jgi:hypothetical protein
MAQLPEIKDYARLNPPWASVVPGRSPVIQWHATRSGARRSAMSSTMRTERQVGEENWQTEWVASEPFGVAMITPQGNLAYVETYDVGDSASKYRNH